MNPSKLPPVTKAVLFANITVHLFVLFQIYQGDSGTFIEIYHKFGLIPSEFMQGAIWQPLTSMFMHGIGGSMTFMHITFNMIGVVSIGLFLERAIGSTRFAVLYFVSGISGGLAVILLSPDLMNPTVGASGALTGLLAAVAILTPQARVLFLFFIPMKMRTLAIGILIASLYFGLKDTDGIISHWGHLGGLLGGFLYTLVSGSKQAMKDRLGGFSQQRPSRSGQVDPVKKIFREILKNRDASQGHATADYSTYYNQSGNIEKEINPQDADSMSSNSDDSDKRVHYDPKTGRFIIR